MMEKFRADLKLIKYGFNLKTILVGAILFTGAGFIVFLGSKGTNFLGGFFMVLAPMWAAQLVYSVDFANLVQSSPRKKELQTLAPTLINLFGMLIVFLLLTLLSMWVLRSHPESAAILTAALLYVAVSGAMIMLYTALAYKTFLLSMILFIVLYVTFLTKVNNFEYDPSFTFPLDFPVSVGLGFLILLVGAVFEYLLSVALYRLPLSKRAQGAALKKYM